MKRKYDLRERLMQKLGATRLIVLSFILIIFIGSCLLCLPMMNKGTPIAWIDSLFIATSATCVTGLIPVALAEQFNYWGLMVVLCLIQIGGLGLMSIVAFVMTMMKHRLYLNEKKLIQDALNKNDLHDVPRFLKTIVRYTFTFEGLGAVLLLFRFIPEYGVAKGIFHSIFLAVSAFCNAGMDSFSSVSLMDYATDPLVNFTITTLIITGSLGFAVWIDLKEKITLKWKKKKSSGLFKTFTVHTRVVLLMTLGLLISGTVLILMTEFTNLETLANLSFFDKLQVAYFQSVTLRTAGFSTVNFAQLRLSTCFVMLFYMIIGGSPGGTAGGIKTTTVAVLFLMVKSHLADNDSITLFKKSISEHVFKRSFVIAMMYGVILTVAIFILTITEKAEFMALLFETVSAIATVGLSLSLTPSLTMIGKIVVILLMFIGRVGPITVIYSMTKFKDYHKPKEVMYPKTDILIG